MEKIGKINIIDENVCKLSCDCGWNIILGGEDKKDLKKIKEFLKTLSINK